MATYLAYRVAAVVPLLVAVAVISFGLVVLLELRGSAAQEVLGEGAADPAAVAAVEAELGLDQALPQRFATWAAGVARGDLGRSLLRPDVPVTTLLAERVWPTASIAAGGLLLGSLLGVGMGAVSGARPGGWADRVVSVTAAGMLAVPGFVAAMVLVVVLVAWAGWFEPTGYAWPSEQGWAAWLRSVTLPAVALSGPVAAVVQRQLRSSLITATGSAYALAARARGASEARVVRCHALRNAMAPAVTVIGFQAAGAVGVTVAVEQVFAVPGMGTLLVQSITQRDLPVVQATLLVTAPVVAAVNLAVDLCYGWLDPRVRLR